MKAFLFCLMMLTGITACTETPKDSESDSKEKQAPVEVSIVDKGGYGQFETEGVITEVANNEEEYASLWKQVHANKDPEPELPDVDFATSKVILIMLDTKTSGGYRIDEPTITDSRNETIVEYREVHPGNKCVTTDALTRPFLFMTIPDNGEQVRFHKKETRIHHCE